MKKLIALMLVGSAGVLNAASITWSSNAITSVTDVSTTGDLMKPVLWTAASASITNSTDSCR